MPKKGRGQGEELHPLKLPTRLQTALEALYGHYEKTFKLWKDKGIKVPPCFIIVCQNTAISKLVYDFISGFHRKNEDGTTTLENGRLQLFRNFDETTGNPLPRPNTLLIDSEQLEAGDALDDNFRGMASDEIERFRREIVERTGDVRAGENITDQELLREVMNTVGKPGQLGGSTRCVVSVSMLTEGWDANSVTHVLGIRAFGTQLPCEQVIGRALRRQSYEANEEGPDKDYSTWNTPTSSACPSTSLRSRSLLRRSRRARRSRSRRYPPTVMSSKSASPASRAIAWSCPRNG
jgi:type III restriction enzyme